MNFEFLAQRRQVWRLCAKKIPKHLTPLTLLTLLTPLTLLTLLTPLTLITIYPKQNSTN